MQPPNNVDDMLGDFLNSPLEHILKFAHHIAQEQDKKKPCNENVKKPNQTQHMHFTQRPVTTSPMDSPRSKNMSSHHTIVYDRWVEEDNYHFLFEIPGICKEDVKVNLVSEGNTAYINVEAVRTAPMWTKIYGESNYGIVKRSVQIPKDVDLTSIEASVANGILKLSLKRLRGVSGSTYKEIPIL